MKAAIPVLSERKRSVLLPNAGVADLYDLLNQHPVFCMERRLLTRW